MKPFLHRLTDIPIGDLFRVTPAVTLEMFSWVYCSYSGHNIFSNILRKHLIWTESGSSLTQIIENSLSS